MEFKDYYKILGVSKNASQDDIKQTFRKLAVKYHPDKTKGDKTSEAKFKEISEAYEVIGDAEKRKKYDEVGENWRYYQQHGGSSGFDWSKFAQGGRTYHYRGGVDDIFGSSGFSDFFETLFGQSFKSGAHGKTAFAKQDYQADINVTLEEAYNGTTKVFEFNGKTIKLKIKPGITNGQVLKLAGKGFHSGDLLLRVNVFKDLLFERKGDDLYADLPVNLYTAILGGKIEFNTFKGKVKIDIQKGTSNGKLLKLTKMGMPVYGKSSDFGELYLTVSVNIPQNLTDKELKLFKELQSLGKHR